MAETTYSSWAQENGISGAWDEKDASGVYNVFRYVFGVQSGEPMMPLVDIMFEDNMVMVETPQVVNASGFDLSIVESSDIAGDCIIEMKPIAATSNVAAFYKVEGPRFNRLKVDAAQ